jgi:hypothetical protein
MRTLRALIDGVALMAQDRSLASTEYPRVRHLVHHRGEPAVRRRRRRLPVSHSEVPLLIVQARQNFSNRPIALDRPAERHFAGRVVRPRRGSGQRGRDERFPGEAGRRGWVWLRGRPDCAPTEHAGSTANSQKHRSSDASSRWASGLMSVGVRRHVSWRVSTQCGAWG